MRRALVSLGATYLLLASGCGPSSLAGPGEPCDPGRACADGLACTDGICAAADQGTDASTPDGSVHGPDASADSDAGPAADGGGSTDSGGLTPDSGGGTPDASSETCSNCGAVPANVCADAYNLKVYDSAPGCIGGQCVFPSRLETCPGGCSQGSCQVDPCANKSCSAPGPTCADANTLRHSSSSCVSGSCVTSTLDQTCAQGCTAGACAAPSCGSGRCDSPSPATCLDPKIIQRSFPVGSCSAGNCSYAADQTWCSLGCLGGYCSPGSSTARFYPARTAYSIAFAVDAADRPHRVETDSAGNVYWIALDETGWREVQVDSNLGSGVQVSLALDSSGSPVIAYFEPTNKRLRYAERRGGTFQIEEVSTASPAGRAPSIAVDGAGTRWISFSDDALGIRVARGQSGNWTFDNLAPGKAALTQIAIDPSGVAHVVWGDPKSEAVASGSYYQPPAFHAKRIGGNWQTQQLDPNGLVFKHGLTFAANGDALIAYGVVAGVGQNDELRLRRDGAINSDELLSSVGNLLSTRALGLYDGARALKFVNQDASILQRNDDGTYIPIALDVPPFTNLIDVAAGPGGEPRFLVNMNPNTPSGVSGSAYYKPAPCFSRCGMANCGADSCGYSCGSCAAGLSCGPAGTCSAWHFEQVNLPRLVSYPSPQLSVALDGKGALHVLDLYQFPERYYTSGTTQNELFYWTDPLALPQPQTVVGIPSGAYAKEAIAPTSLLVDRQGKPEAVYAYAQSGANWTIDFASKSGASWATQALDSNGRQSPGMRAAARNEAGVVYVVYRCGYYSDVFCADRYEGGNVAKSNVGSSADARAASVAVDAQGHAHVLWTHGMAGSPYNSAVLEYATDASGSWVSTPISGQQSNTTSEPFSPRIALAPDGTVSIAFNDLTGALTVGTLRSPGFSLEAVPNGSGVFSFGFAVDPSGRPAVLASTPLGMLFLRREASSWSQELIPYSSGGGTGPSWLAFDAAGSPHAVFWDSVLRHAWRP